MFISYQVKIAISLMLFTISVGVGWIAFPLIFKRHIQRNINLAPGSQSRMMWQAFPFPFEFSIHVLNVTSPEAIKNGGKPVVEDIGPFVFDEFKDKYDFHDNDEDDSVSFNMRNTYIFRPDKSSGLTGEELITIPHPIIQNLAISLKRERPDLMEFLDRGLGIVFNNSDPFLTAPFMDIFFRGILIDCDHEDFTATSVCVQLGAGNIKGMRKVNDTHLAYSLMGGSNHTNAGRLTVLRGQRNPKHIGKVIQVDGKTHLDIWPGKKCSKLRGTDGTIFAPFLNPKFHIWSYSTDLCRSISLKQEKSVLYAGLPATRFVMDFEEMENDGETKCFCLSYPDNCPAKGTFDLLHCTFTPMIASMPHFYHADHNLLRKVGGLDPIKSLHETFIDFEIISGTPLSVYKRLQFNLDVEPVPEVYGMDKLQRVVMPMFWIEESINLTPAVTDELHKMFRIITINSVLKWGAFFASIVGFAFVIYMKNKPRESFIVPLD